MGLEGCGAGACAVPGRRGFGGSGGCGVPGRGPDACCGGCGVGLAADGQNFWSRSAGDGGRTGPGGLCRTKVYEWLVDTSHTLDCCCAHSTSLNKKRFSGFSKQLSSFTRRSYYTTHNARDRECCPGCAQSSCPRSSLVCVQQSPSKFEEFLYSRRSTAET